MNNTTKFLFAAVIILAIGAYFYPSATNLFGAEGDSNLTNLVTSGYITDGGVLTVGGGSTATKFVCAVASWNPPSLASSGNPLSVNGTSSIIAFATSSVFTGFTATRPIDVSIEITTTTPYEISGNNVAGAATTSLTVDLKNFSVSASFDAVTSTVDACQWQ